jgi:hypothetical protein
MTRDENPYSPPSDDRGTKKRSHKNLVGLIVAAAVALAAPVVGAVVSVFFLNRAFEGTAEVEPSQKARVLGEGISRAMNGAACGSLVSCAALASAIVFAVRIARSRG